MKSQIYLAIIVICCFCIACNNGKRWSGAEHYIQVNGFEDKVYSLEELGITVKALILDPEALYSCISSIQLPTDQKHLYISDDCTQTITVIDRNTGELKIAKKMQGRGPGEYTNVGILKIHNDTVIIYDTGPNQALRYDLNLKFIDSKDMKFPQCIEYINVDDGVLGYNLAIYEDSPYRIYHKDNNSDLLGTYINLKDFIGQRNVTEIGNRFTKNRHGDVLLSHSFSNEIYEWQDGVKHKYSIDFGRRSKPAKLSIYGDELLYSHYVFIRNFFEVNNKLIFSFDSWRDETMYHGFYNPKDGSICSGQIAPEHEMFLFYPRWQNGDELIGCTDLSLLPENVEIINKSQFDEGSLEEDATVVLFYTFHE